MVESFTIVSTSLVTVITRHSPNWPKIYDRWWKRFNCRKNGPIRERSRGRIVSAKTHSSRMKLAQTQGAICAISPGQNSKRPRAGCGEDRH